MLNYIEDYDAAVENFKLADQVDPTLNSKESIAMIFDRVRNVEQAIANKVLLAQKIQYV